MSESPGPPSRSLFVTVVAWLGIAFGLMTLATGAVMVYGFTVLFGGPQLEAELATMAADPHVPAYAGWVLGHLSVLIYATAALGLAVLAASVAMLRRRNWGRLGVLATLWLGIAVNLAGAALTVLAVQLLPADLLREATASGIDAQRITWGLMATVVGAVIIIVALQAWIIQQLMGAETRREFDRT